jgi:hypothetical protein
MHRIEPDPIRAAPIGELFRLYASGDYSLKSLLQRAHTLGLTHPRSRRRLFKSELHRMLQNPIYYGDFMWDGKQYRGSHEPLITRELFEEAQAVFRGRPRARYPRQRHPFMGLLTCGQCGCAITAERKKGKYVFTTAQITTEPVRTPTSVRNASATCWATYQIDSDHTGVR